MVLSGPSVTIGALLCTEVVLTLMFYRRGGSQRRPWISRLTRLLTAICSAIPLVYLCDIYPYSSWAIVGTDIIFLSMLVSVRGNVARLIDAVYK